MKTQRKIITAIGSCVIFAALLILIVFTTPQAKANAFTGHYGVTLTTDAQKTAFLSETNTFNVQSINQSTRQITYNMASRNNNTTLAVPQITVLTHGLSGDGGHWSSQYDGTKGSDAFAYDPDSLINRLSINADGANIYWAVMQSNKENFNLYDITNKTGKYSTSSSEKEEIDDISKHIIIVFEADDNNGANDDVYYEFNFMLSRIVYDVKYLNGGILPKINLIGHSRGGITNLQYALDHPDLIASLVSIGTPYFGTTTGDLATLINTGPGRDDVTDFNKFSAYNTRWNTSYDSLYSNINALAIGGYSSIEFLAEALWNDVSGTMPNNAAKIASGALLEEVGMLIATLNSSPAKIAVTQLLEYFFPTSAVASLAHILVEEIIIDLSQPSAHSLFARVSWFNDVLVHLDSQLAYKGSLPGVSSYSGFKRMTRFFDVDDGTDFSKVSMRQIPVAHNLEARDAQIISWILDSVSVMPVSVTPLITTSNLAGNEVEITGITTSITDAFIIPSEILGKKVTRIGNSAFAGQTGLTSVVIPGTVRSIGSLAFWGCTGLTSIALPNSVTNIETGAFSDCTALTKFVVPDSVISIGSGAFYGCSNLISISVPFVGESSAGNNNNFGYIFGAQISYVNQNSYIPSALKTVTVTGGTSIGANAFDGCTNLKSIGISAGITTIGANVFKGCSSLAALSIPNSVTSIGVGVLFQCSNLAYISIPFVGATLNGTVNTDFEYLFTYAATAIIPSTLKTVAITGGNSIKADAFYGCQDIMSIAIPNTVTTIGTGAFEDCTSITNIEIPASVTSIGNYAFNNCLALKKIYVSRTSASGITTLGISALGNCPQLLEISVPSVAYKTAANWSAHANVIYSTAATAGLSYTLTNSETAYTVSRGTSTASTVTIPDIYRGLPVVAIDEGGFQNYNNMTSISVPTRITSIPAYAFSGCTSLSAISIPSAVISIGNNAFQSCISLSDVTIPSSVVTIGASAFSECRALTSMTVPNNVTGIGSGAFANCLNLKVVRINKISAAGVITLGANAFGGTTALSAIYVPDATTQTAYKSATNWSVYSSVIFAANGTTGLAYTLINNGTAYSVSAGTATANNIIIPESYNGLRVTSIGNSAFSQKTNIASITIPYGIINISDFAFASCRSLVNISIPSSVTSIGGAAFQNCVGLASVTLSSNMTSIDGTVFMGCTSLTSITIPSGITSIGNGAFWNCSALASVTLPSTVTAFGMSAFKNCTSLTSFTIPSTVSVIADSMFSGCSVLANVVIPSSVATIEANAFSSCIALTNLTISNNVTSVGNNAFYGCSNLSISWDYNATLSTTNFKSNLKTVYFSATVREIPANKFLNCTKLSINTLPVTVTSIGSGAFSGCTGWTSFTLPRTVTSIGSNAFSGCTNLSIAWDYNPALTSAYFKDYLKVISFAIGNTDISANAFSGATRITNLLLPSTLRTIGSSAFSGCTGITTLSIPSTVTSVGSNAFSGCTNLSITWQYHNSTMTAANFSANLKAVNLSGTTISANAFSGCTKLTSITIPSGITSIGNNAFSSSGLRKVIIPLSVSSMGSNVFSSCSSLTIYTKASGKPSGWSSSWNSSNCPVYLAPASASKDIMTLFGYMSGSTYYWRGAVKLTMSNIGNCYVSTGGVYAFTGNSTLTFEIRTEASKNAISKINGTLDFTLRNSASSVIPIGGASKHHIEVEVSTKNKVTFSGNSTTFSISTANLSNGTYTLTLVSLFARAVWGDGQTKTFTFVVDK